MPTIRSLKTRLLLSNSFLFTVFHSNWQYFTHSNSQQFTVIHCDEPNTGFEPRLISAYFFARWSGWRLRFISEYRGYIIKRTATPLERRNSSFESPIGLSIFERLDWFCQ